MHECHAVVTRRREEVEHQGNRQKDSNGDVTRDTRTESWVASCGPLAVLPHDIAAPHFISFVTQAPAARPHLLATRPVDQLSNIEVGHELHLSLDARLHLDWVELAPVVFVEELLHVEGIGLHVITMGVIAEHRRGVDHRVPALVCCCPCAARGVVIHNRRGRLPTRRRVRRAGCSTLLTRLARRRGRLPTRRRVRRAGCSTLLAHLVVVVRLTRAT